MTLKQRQRELDPTRAALAQEVLGLFEALCWTAPDGQETRYFSHPSFSSIIFVTIYPLSDWLLLFEGIRSSMFYWTAVNRPGLSIGLSVALCYLPAVSVLYKLTSLTNLPLPGSGLFRHLLSFPENLESDKEQDYSKIPQIERLFSYLADDSRCSKEASVHVSPLSVKPILFKLKRRPRWRGMGYSLWYLRCRLHTQMLGPFCSNRTC